MDNAIFGGKKNYSVLRDFFADNYSPFRNRFYGWIPFHGWINYP